MKNIKIISLIMIFVLCALGLGGCAGSGNSAAANADESASVSDFKYPKKSAFKFEVSESKVTAKKGDVIKINCFLKNTSKNDYHIEHGSETITYSYNDESEVITALAVLDDFKSDSEIQRGLEITADESGEIIVYAEISVKPSRFSEEMKTYNFEKKIKVTVTE